MHFERTRRKTKSIQMISLVDVMMFCLFFFMLTTSFIKIQSLEMGLPDVDGNQAIDRSITVDMAGNGEMLWNHAPIPLEVFGQQVKQTLALNPGQSFLVRAGEGVTVQKLVDVLDMVYSLGGRNVAVEKLPASDELPAAVPLNGGIAQ